MYSGTGTVLHEFPGGSSLRLFGEAVAGPGDLNGDSIPDVVIGAPLASSTRGMVFAYSGAPPYEELWSATGS